MTSKQESKFSMQLVVRDYLIANVGITATLPNYDGFFNGVRSGIIAVQNIRTQQEADKTGIAVNKLQLKANLISLAMDVSRKMVAYASIDHKSELLQEVNYSESALKISADTVLKDRCQVIYDRAIANLAALSAYSVTAAIVNNLLSALTAYNVAIPKPRLGITDKKRATKKLVVLLKEVDANLAKIDLLVEIVRKTETDFYTEYKNVRKIVATGVGVLAVRGSIRDAESGMGLAGASVRFAAAGGSGGVVKIKKTTLKGGFNIKSLAEGSYTVTVKKLGYQDGVVVVHVTDGERSLVEVGLVVA